MMFRIYGSIKLNAQKFIVELQKRIYFVSINTWTLIISNKYFHS